MRSMRSALRALGEGVSRRRLVIAGAGLCVAVVTFAACGGCGRRAAQSGGPADPVGPTGSAAAVNEAGAPPARDPLAWSSAKGGDDEDLTALAAQEGAAGLVEATADPDLKPTAIRAMGHAAGFAQLPFLAKAATAGEDAEAELALDAVLELATRPRRSEDVEDAEELREGCEALALLARTATRPKPRRVAAVRAVRMMPCPPAKAGEELPTDLDAK